MIRGVFLSVLFGMLLAGHAVAQTLKPVDFSAVNIVTSEYPPYSFSEDDEIKGVAVERTRKVLSKLQLDTPITIYPWARAYETARVTPNTLIFSMARSQEREKAFKWVGTIVDFNVKIFKLKERDDIHVEKIADLANYSIGALNRDIKGNYLRSQGLKPQTYASEETGIRMLFRGRIDLMPIDMASFKYRMDNLNLPIDAVEEVITLSDISHPLYMAFNQQTPDAVVNAFREALDAVHKEETAQ